MLDVLGSEIVVKNFARDNLESKNIEYLDQQPIVCGRKSQCVFGLIDEALLFRINKEMIIAWK